MRTVNIIITVYLLLFIAGCQPEQSKEDYKTLKQNNEKLQSQLEQCSLQKERLENQVEGLRGFPKEVRENALDLQKITISRFTGFYNDNGKKKLYVYFVPIDSKGDTIKAPGTANIQLWSLNKPQQEALLAEWKIGTDVLENEWFGGLLGSNYRLVFDINDQIANISDPMTVKVDFTNALTGKMLQAQKVIKLEVID